MDWLYILLIVFISTFVSSTIGFGDALILVPLLASIIGVREAIVLTGFWTILVSVFNFIKYFRWIDRRYWKIVGMSGVPGVLLGSILIGILNVTYIQFLLGIFIILFVMREIFQFWRDTGQITEGRILPVPILTVGGFSYGFLGGLIGASGPVNVMMLQVYKYSRETFIGTFAAVGVILSAIKLTVYIVTDLFPLALWAVYLLGIPMIIIATRLGHKISSQIPLKVFRGIILVFLVIIGIRTIILSF